MTLPLRATTHAKANIGVAIVLAASMVALGGCNGSSQHVQQPYSPTSPSTSPTSTTPREPASTRSVASPAKSSTQLPSPSSSTH